VWRRNLRYNEWLIGPAFSADIAGYLTAFHLERQR
jgi:hypothetical protein